MPDLRRRCAVSNAEFTVTEAEQAHLIRMGSLHPAINEPLPLPTTHPWVFARLLLIHSNVYNLYQGQSAFSGKSQLTRYNPELGYRICTVDEFWEERIENSEAGMDYNFSRPFFDQFNELLHRIYLLPLNVTNVENSSYVNAAVNLRNCYLCFVTYDSQDCLYCQGISQSNDCVDCVQSRSCQFCYSCVNIEHCYECQHCADCRDSSNCLGCLDCIGCHDCLGCVGLRSARHCIFNEQYSEDDYFAYLSQFNRGDRRSRADLLSRCRDFVAAQRHTVLHNVNVENCSGNYLVNSKNLLDCHFTNDSQDCGYLLYARFARDAWRGVAEKAELLYESAGYPGSYHTAYSFNVVGGEGNLYGYGLYNSCSHCFGCALIKGKSYCILNRQYSKAEYLDLVPRIVQQMKQTGEWGRFFPAEISPHVYEESLVDTWLEPIPLEEAARRRYNMQPRGRHLAGPEALNSASLPMNIEEVGSAALSGRPISCEKTGEIFSLAKAEINYYKRFNIPLPTLHWRERLIDLRNALQRVPGI